MNSLSIDIGGTFIKYAVLDSKFNILKKWKKVTKPIKDTNEFYDYVCDEIIPDDIGFIGVSAPGVIAEDSKVLSKAASNVRAMYLSNVNYEVFKRMNLPVQTINDGKSAGYCELKMGNGRNSKSSAYFIIGTGIGGCVCIGEKIIEGVDRIAGEFSNIPIGFYKENPSKMIGLAKIASMTALIDIYNKKCNGTLKLGEEITRLFLKGDSNAVEAINEWCKNIVMGLYMWIDVNKVDTKRADTYR